MTWCSANKLNGGGIVIFRNLLLLSLIFLVAACASATSIADSTDRISPTANFVEDYKLGVGDKVKITVFGEESLSGEFLVNANGGISLPLIGNVEAATHSAADLTKDIEARLGDGYIRNPKVAMEVLTYRPFFIMGEVGAPGQYPYSSGLTVMNAIATAQGYTPRADRKVIFIRRSGASEEKAFRMSPDLRVWPGDTIRLGERFF